MPSKRPQSVLMLLLLPWGSKTQAVASISRSKAKQRKRGFHIYELKRWTDDYLKSDISTATGCLLVNIFFLLTLFPPEYSEPKEVSSSAPVEEPSWSLSLLLLNRFGRLGPLQSWKEEGFFIYRLVAWSIKRDMISLINNTTNYTLPLNQVLAFVVEQKNKKQPTIWDLRLLFLLNASRVR